MLTRKLTMRHSAEADRVHASEAALDISKILPNWGAEQRATLLERPLFGFASYGRVRFHHRSVVEFLAANVSTRFSRGWNADQSDQAPFDHRDGAGTRTVRPSMRPVAAWLALWRESIFC